MNISYRRLTPLDSKIYRETRLESLKLYPDNFGSNYEEQKALPKLAFEQFIEQQVPDKFIVGAFAQEKLVGLCGFFSDFDKIKMKQGQIIQMYVKPEFQGNKIGLNLLRATIGEAFKLPHITTIILEVKTENEHATQLYEKAGFEKLKGDSSTPEATMFSIQRV
jgi:ribosomal protein S18 acetylase RimI-like enzyme